MAHDAPVPHEVPSETDEMTCRNCGRAADVRVVEPVPSCPACAPSAMGGSFVVHVRVPEGYLVANLHQLGWRWGVLYDESVRQWRAENGGGERPAPRDARPWWRRIFSRGG